jgi:hypothetical protein
VQYFFPESQGADLVARLQKLDQVLSRCEGEGKSEREQSFHRFREEEKARAAMPRRKHYDEENDYNQGYSFGMYAASDDEELDYKDQDQVARELYELLEGHEPDEDEEGYARLVGHFDQFEEGFSNGYTTEWERKHR